MEKKTPALKTYEVIFNYNPETTKKVAIEGYSTLIYAVNESHSVFQVLDCDGKTPLLSIDFGSFVACRLISEDKILKVRKNKKIVSISGEDDDETEL